MSTDRPGDKISLKLVVILGSVVATMLSMFATMVLHLSRSNDRLVSAVVEQMKTQHSDSLVSQRAEHGDNLEAQKQNRSAIDKLTTALVETRRSVKALRSSVAPSPVDQEPPRIDARQPRIQAKEPPVQTETTP